MSNITVTAKIQIQVSNSHRATLLDTMRAYKSACNYVSRYCYKNHNLKQISLHQELYSVLRTRFGLKSQMAESVIKTVIAKYKTVKSSGHPFTEIAFKKPQYDLVWNRDYSLNQGMFSVNTLPSRIKLPYYAQGMQKYFNSSIYTFGTAKLVLKHNKFFLHIPVTYEAPECAPSDVVNIVGVDRGINFIAATYDSKGKSSFYSGKSIKNKRAHYQVLRTQLQQKQTPSSRRKLKSIGNRENRWMQDVNHQVSKALVLSHPKKTMFVLEDLTGIRTATERVRKRDRCVSVSWSFYDLEQKLSYKAAQYGSLVVKVDPAYTSQTCPKCGHTHKSNRNKKTHTFLCKNCNYQSNDDRIGAMNLHRKGIELIVPDAGLQE